MKYQKVTSTAKHALQLPHKISIHHLICILYQQVNCSILQFRTGKCGTHPTNIQKKQLAPPPILNFTDGTWPQLGSTYILRELIRSAAFAISTLCVSIFYGAVDWAKLMVPIHSHRSFIFLKLLHYSRVWRVLDTRCRFPRGCIYNINSLCLFGVCLN